MDKLPEPLAALAHYKQFCIYKLVPNLDIPGKMNKFPCDFAGGIRDAHDETIWLDAQTAVTTAGLYGDEYGVAFVFTENDPFYFFDIDDCLLPDGETWSPIAMELLGRFSGAAVEVSQSGRGLHIFGTGSPTTPPDERRKKAKDPISGNSKGLFDLYTEKRFVALTGRSMLGSVSHLADQVQLDYIVEYWLKKGGGGSEEWTSEPTAAWTGTDDDDELIERALKTGGAGAVFGNKATFRDLWENNEDLLIECYPDDQGLGRADSSRVDAALAQHLAFWTGNNCERILKLMWLSGLVREKWTDREGDYLERTITRAVSMQDVVYSVAPVDDSIAEQFGGVRLRATSDAQRDYAVKVRAEKLAECQGEIELLEIFCKVPTAKFWLDNKDRSVEELRAVLKPVDAGVAPLGDKLEEVQILSGYQYLGATQQVEYFKGCVYVQEIHKVFTPNGSLLKPEIFNATYGGYSFQLDDGGDKVTRKAWEAFTESQVVRYPIAEATVFRPLDPPGALIREEGRNLVNSYIPVETPRKAGDVTRFIEHVARILPIERDREIVLSYMAACIQHKGVKFQWAPLIQGAPGNGKTLLTRCVSFAIGNLYTHLPLSGELGEKFNDWLFGKLFIGIEDVYVPEHKKEIIEVLKPMITNDRLAKRAMQTGQVMGDNFANFILNSNHKDAIRKNRNDRRFAVFFCPQQTNEDIDRDGMGGDYFPSIYRWLKADGYAIVSDYLTNYAIPDELNPAGACHRAPDTSSTSDAIVASLGGIEQEILEAIEEGRPGFAGGWISSVAVERLLHSIHAARSIPHNKRRELLQSLGYDWHPALAGGRVNNPIPMDEGKKPRLFIRQGHISANIETPAEVSRIYQEAQGSATITVGSAASVFK
jgi:primase-polymerase (primpol)-like protein